MRTVCEIITNNQFLPRSYKRGSQNTHPLLRDHDGIGQRQTLVARGLEEQQNFEALLNALPLLTKLRFRQAAPSAAKLAAVAPAKLPQPRCRCLHRRRTAAATTTALSSSCCHRHQAGCRLRGVATALPPPPLPLFLSSSLSLSSLPFPLPLLSLHLVDC